MDCRWQLGAWLLVKRRRALLRPLVLCVTCHPLPRACPALGCTAWRRCKPSLSCAASTPTVPQAYRGDGVRRRAHGGRHGGYDGHQGGVSGCVTLAAAAAARVLQQEAAAACIMQPAASSRLRQQERASAAVGDSQAWLDGGSYRASIWGSAHCRTKLHPWLPVLCPL